MTITAAELYALFEPIRQRDGSWWPEGLEGPTVAHPGCFWSPDSPLEDHFSRDIILAAGLRWLAGGGHKPALMRVGGGLRWTVNLGVMQSVFGSGPTPYHALAAAMRAVLGMAPLAP